MRRCIIDNSTLTAVDRLLGVIPISNFHQIDGDISAFENLIQAILFNDHLSMIDDYKDEYKVGRHSRYGYLTLLKPDTSPYNEATLAARKIVQGIAPAVESGRFQDSDFAPFMDMLKTNLAFSCRMHSSVHWLTISMLADKRGKEIHRYSKVWEAISQQLSERDNSAERIEPLRHITLHEKDGSKRTTDSLKNTEGVYETLGDFMSSLSWLAFRTTFYTIYGMSTGSDVILHPIRHAFRVNVLHRHLGLAPDAYSLIVAAMNDKIKATTREILSPTQPIVCRLDLPYFSAYLVNKVRSVSNVVDAALELKSDRVFRDAREQLFSLQTLENRKDYVSKANKIILQLETTAQMLRSEYCVSGKQGIQSGPIVAVAGALLGLTSGVSVPGFNVKIPLPNKITKLLGRSGFSGIFRSIVEDLTAIERLGTMRTRLASSTNTTGARRHMAPAENPRWFGKDSSIRKWQ